MNIDKLPHGKNAPYDISLVIEISSPGFSGEVPSKPEQWHTDGGLFYDQRYVLPL